MAALHFIAMRLIGVVTHINHQRIVVFELLTQQEEVCLAVNKSAWRRLASARTVQFLGDDVSDLTKHDVLA